MWQVFLISVTLVFLAAASYSDLKKREVPDWLSYGLIFSAVGLRFIFSFAEGWMIFLNGLLGLLVCIGIAYLFYFANFWGGGDGKLLMGMGAVIGLSLNLLWFFLSLLFLGAIMGLLWGLFVAALKWRRFVKEFKGFLSLMRKWHFLAGLISLVFLGASFFYWYFWPLIIFPLGSFYLICFVKAVEESCFVKKVSVEELVEGDWLAKDVVVSGKRIAVEGRGLEKKEIHRLRNLFGEEKINEVLVKEGIPLVPSFLAAYLVIVFVDWGWFLGIFG
jgi:Flp pilus assembly protein protease CpaA